MKDGKIQQRSGLEPAVFYGTNRQASTDANEQLSGLSSFLKKKGSGPVSLLLERRILERLCLANYPAYI